MSVFSPWMTLDGPSFPFPSPMLTRSSIYFQNKKWVIGNQDAFKLGVIYAHFYKGNTRNGPYCTQVLRN